MSKPYLPNILWYLIRDTFQQARATGLGWLLFAIWCIVVLFCLSVGVSGNDPIQDLGNTEFISRNDSLAETAKNPAHGVAITGGELTIAFGIIRFPLHRDVGTAVRFIQLILAWGIADTLGILLAIIWTAGSMPRFLDASTLPYLLIKPVPSWCFVLGKYLGGVALVASYSTIYLLSTWLVLGIRTGVWSTSYLHCLPNLVMHFSVFYSVSVLIAVYTRSTVSCIFGTLVFWLLCWSVNYGHHVLQAMNPNQSPGGILVAISEVTYWLFPKPVDFGRDLFDNQNAHRFFNKMTDINGDASGRQFTDTMIIVQSIVFIAVMMLLASRQLRRVPHRLMF